jgi:hypothetical protein
MGLDMYLMRANREEAEGWKNLSCDERTSAMDQSPWTEVCYWRKANQIRQWFVDNCDYPADGNCDEAEVTKENLEALIEVCRKVLENPELADELLPCSKGFFFGSQDYDEWYFNDLKNTIAACTGIIATTDWEKEIVTYSDWW